MNPYAGCYVEKVGEKWQISNPDGGMLYDGYGSKGAATRFLRECIRDFRDVEVETIDLPNVTSRAKASRQALHDFRKTQHREQ